MFHSRTFVPMHTSIPASRSTWLIAVLLSLLPLLGHGLLAPATALAQPVEWKQLQVTARDSHAMAYDSDRHVTVLFGGLTTSDVLSNETWEWSGTTGAWTQRIVSGPSPRRGHTMVYDADRRVSVLFGGQTASGQSSETWEWNGNTWTLRCSTCGPSPRSDSAMVYDSDHHVTVLFGGYTGTDPGTADTWEWNGSVWTLAHSGVVGAPSPRHAHAMTYDSTHHVTLLFGGFVGPDGVTSSDETWEWNGTGWTLADAGGPGRPSARFGHAMACDLHGVTVLFGGHTYVGPADYGDTWEWNGTAWAEVHPVTRPAPSVFHAMAYDLDRDKIVLFGGGANGFVIDGTWEWNGSGGGTWTQRTTNGPVARYSCAMAYHASQSETVLYGGYIGNAGQEISSSNTWTWNGAAWTNRSGPGPGGRASHAMTYDADRSVTLLFSGHILQRNGGVSSNSDSQTWWWDGQIWTLRATVGPSPRLQAGMTYDSVHHVAVLFGGHGLDGASNGETWTWDGTEWTQRLVIGPPARRSPGMCFDAARGVAVLFGGFNDATGVNFGDTWEWNGTTWTERIAGGPSPRFGHAMAFDTNRNVTVLIGGSFYNNGNTFNGETWEWNGTSWSQRFIAGPSTRSSHAAVYDSARRLTTLFGGATGQERHNDTWGLYATCTAASIIAQPSQAAACPSGPAGFAVTAAGLEPFTYQWQYQSGPNNPDQFGWTDLVSGQNPPVGPSRLNAINPQTRLLVVDHDPTLWPNAIADRIPYKFRCIVTNACGSVTSNEATLTVCPADFNCDGFLDFFDYDAFVECFETEACGGGTADFNGDGFIDFFDYDDFVAAFEAGC